MSEIAGQQLVTAQGVTFRPCRCQPARRICLTSLKSLDVERALVAVVVVEVMELVPVVEIPTILC